MKKIVLLAATALVLTSCALPDIEVDSRSPEPASTATASVASEAPSAPSPTDSPSQEPVADPSAEADEPTDAPAEPTFKRVSARQWKQILKDPDSHFGEHYLIYGVITQFDAATGVDSFRADTGPRRTLDWYDYDDNTFLIGDEEDLADFVEGDIFAAKVTGAGSLTYDTQIGGSTTVPQFTIWKIKRIGQSE